MREAGDVCYADVFKDGTGVVEFQRRDDMRYAVKKLDDTKFRSHEVGIMEYQNNYNLIYLPLVYVEFSICLQFSPLNHLVIMRRSPTNLFLKKS